MMRVKINNLNFNEEEEECLKTNKIWYLIVFCIQIPNVLGKSLKELSIFMEV